MSYANRSNNSFSEAEAKKKIRKLTVQNKRLQREIDALKQEVDELQGKGGKFWRQSKYRSALQRRSDCEDMYSKKSYPAFIWSHIKHTSFFHIYRRVISYIRRYAFITTSLKIISLLFVFVETIALIVISTSAFIASVILTLLMSYILMIFTFFTRKKHTSKNTELLKNKNIVIFFPPKERAFERDSYFYGLVKDLSKRQDTVVIVVSPFLLDSRGLGNSKKAYYLDRTDGEDILLVRRNYYFTLKKKIIEPLGASVTEIY